MPYDFLLEGLRLSLRTVVTVAPLYRFDVVRTNATMWLIMPAARPRMAYALLEICSRAEVFLASECSTVRLLLVCHG